jgi:hypothetical protein
MNNTEPLWSILETRLRNRFPPPTSLKKLENVLQEEWYKMQLQTVQNFYESIPRSIPTLLKAEGGPASYCGVFNQRIARQQLCKHDMRPQK